MPILLVVGEIIPSHNPKNEPMLIGNSMKKKSCRIMHEFSGRVLHVLS